MNGICALVFDCMRNARRLARRHDHESVVAGAARCGLRTCYMSQKFEYGEGRIVEPEPMPGTFDLMVDGLDELADLLLR